MDCADCARKVAEAARALPGVESAQVSFASGRLYVVFRAPEAEGRLGRVLEPLGYRLRPEGQEEGPPGPFRAALFSGALLLLALGWNLLAPAPWAYALAALVGVLPLARRALARRDPFSIQALVTLAVLGALVIGAEAEGAVVVFLFLLGEVLEAYSVRQARKGIRALTHLLPKRALRLVGDRVEEVPLSALRVGDRVRVPEGERVPADGVVLEGRVEVEEAAFTGEPLPQGKAPGDRVYGGSLVLLGSLTFRVEVLSGAGLLGEMERLAEKALARKGRLERLVDAFSRRYTPLVFLFALFWGGVLPLFRGEFPQHLYQALALLLIACPCALVLSVPTAIAAGVARGARFGVLFKDGGALERLAGVRHLALDKTGTLTLGSPCLVEVLAFGVSREEALALALGLEAGSAHPLARAVREAASDLKPLPVEALRVVPGEGVHGRFGGEEVALLTPRSWPHPLPEAEALAQRGHALALLLKGGRPLALLAFQDAPRPEAKTLLEQLRALGLRLHLLSGDPMVRPQAEVLGFRPEEVRAGLSPKEKLQAVEALAREGVAMVGDGVNDAPALAQATVGLAVAEGTGVAQRAADAVLLGLPALETALRLARATRRVLYANLALALGLKGLFLLTTLLGLTGLWPAVLSDTGATVLVTLNALRLLAFQPL